ncbi:barstar family protein, partial [Candidatus Fermentibacteria bacterium]|nr:barstar family protein [Candidatus Fermentibacteria bacterium]
MHDWTVALSSYLSSGIYPVAAAFEEDVVRLISERNGLDFIRIDLGAANTGADLLAAFAAALHFPSYFGRNWDALYDCLADLSWRPACGYALLLVGFEALSGRAGAELAPAAGLL